MGGIGSGKTSGPMDNFLLPALRAGCGAVWLCAKPDEPERAVRLAREAGREADVILFKPGSGHCLDPLHAELTATGGSVEAAVAMIDSVVQVSSRAQSGQGEDSFWRHLQLKVADFVVRTVYLARGTCSLLDAYSMLSSAPNSPEEVNDKSWRNASFCAKCLVEARIQYPDNTDVNLCADWWLDEWVRMADRTRGIAHTQLTNVLKKFIHEPLRSMVAGRSTLSPDDPQLGKLLVLAMPVMQYRELGQFFGVLMKTLVQRATLRRDTKASPRPVLCVQDEAQWFILPDVDAMAQTVARQSRYISCAATQTIPGLIAALGGSEKARHEAEAWIGLHMTKILCANACKESNQFFSDLIGQHKEMFLNANSGGSHQWDPIGELMGESNRHVHVGFSENLAPELMPSEFLKLKKGAGPNGFIVEAICFQGGRLFANGRTWVRGRFKQRI